MATIPETARAQAGGVYGTAPGAPVRVEIADALERLARMLVQRAAGPHAGGAEQGHDTEDILRIRETIRLLGQVAAGTQVLPDALAVTGAGLGSSVEVEDADTGETETYVLMAGAMINFDAGQVSLASPVGQALLGTTGGELVHVDTPQRRRRLRVVRVKTLRDVLDGTADL